MGPPFRPPNLPNRIPGRPRLEALFASDPRQRASARQAEASVEKASSGSGPEQGGGRWCAASRAQEGGYLPFPESGTKMDLYVSYQNKTMVL